MSERYFPIDNLTPAMRVRHSLIPSLLFPPNAMVRAGDLQLQVVSVNDKKNSVSLRLVGVFLKPKTDADGNVEVVEEKLPMEEVIIVPKKRIITP